jgi:hypothetical protein
MIDKFFPLFSAIRWLDNFLHFPKFSMERPQCSYQILHAGAPSSLRLAPRCYEFQNEQFLYGYSKCGTHGLSPSVSPLS